MQTGTNRRKATGLTGRISSFALIVAITAWLPLAPAQAASVSYFLDQSNKLPDGVNYLQVTLTEDGSGVDFLVKTLDPLNSIAGGNFGIQKFGFNFTSNTPYEISGLPDDWKVKKDKRMDGFGRYDIRLQGKGKARTDALSFTVGGVALADFDDFFAAHVAGFERGWCGDKHCVTSAYFGGDTPVPLPATAWLFGSGLLGLVGVARRRRSRAHSSSDSSL